MNENSSYGFCDLNLSVEEVDLKKTILKGLKLGYETFAINMIVSDEIKDLKINKKGNKIFFFCRIIEFRFDYICFGKKN